MDSRVRLFGLLLAALCAVGWIPNSFGSSRAGQSHDSISADDGVTALPARRQGANKIGVERSHDNDASLAGRYDTLETACNGHVDAPTALCGDPLVVLWRSAAHPRGPPSIA